MAVLAARLALTLEASVGRFLNAADQDLGHLEAQVLHDVQTLLRETLQRAAQAKADTTPPHCPVCGQPLSRCSSGHVRTFQTRVGDMTIERARRYCSPCRKWRTPADTALGLDDTAGYSPAVQALVALAASRLPIADASVVWEHWSGVKLPPATWTARPNARVTAPSACAANSMRRLPPPHNWNCLWNPTN